MKPYIVREGDLPPEVAAAHGCREDEICRDRDAPADEARGAGPGWKPGDVVRVPDRPQQARNVAIGDVNRFDGNTPPRTVKVRLLSNSGEEAPIGTEYWLKIDGQKPVEGKLSSPGEVGVFVLTANQGITLKWGAYPAVKYEAPKRTFAELAAGAPSGSSSPCRSRAAVLKAGTFGAVLDEMRAALDSNRDGDADCADRFKADLAAFTDKTHAHHYVAIKVDSLVTKAGGFTWPSSKTLASGWDFRWFAVHPLLPHFYPVPQVDDSKVTLYAHSALLKIEPDPTDASRRVATASVTPWYNRVLEKSALLGVEGRLVSNRGGAPRGANEPWLELLTAVNKRLVKLWMGELKLQVPVASNPWLGAWMDTDDAREHFRRWCQVVNFLTWDGGDGHQNRCAIDIDYSFNPWAPLFTSERSIMRGEPNKGDLSAAGRAYDRALRLFVQPQGADLSEQARWLATTYYRNNWDWKPDDIDQIHRNYQALHWALIAYFDYLTGRAVVPRNPASNADCGLLSKRTGKALWEAIASDQKFLRPNAELLLEVPLVGLDALRSQNPGWTRQIVWPFGGKATVWNPPLKELAAKASGFEEALGNAIAQQMSLDHAALVAATQRDACRGIFSIGYEVSLAFGRVVSETQDLTLLRMFSFGMNDGANGGDFMHIEFGEARPFGRALERLDLKVDGKNVVEWRVSYEGGKTPTASLRVEHTPANAARPATDVSREANVTSTNEAVCRVTRTAAQGWKLEATGDGTCEVVATRGGLQSTLRVVVVWNLPC